MFFQPIETNHFWCNAYRFECQGCYKVHPGTSIFKKEGEDRVLCLECRDGDPDYKPDTAARLALLRLVARCPNHLYGCRVRMTVREIPRHLRRQCKFTDEKRALKKALLLARQLEKAPKPAPKPHEPFGYVSPELKSLINGERKEEDGPENHIKDGVLKYPNKPMRWTYCGWCVFQPRPEMIRKQGGLRWMDTHGWIRVLSFRRRYTIEEQHNFRSTERRNERSRARILAKREGGSLRTFKSAEEAIEYRRKQRAGRGFVHRDRWYTSFMDEYYNIVPIDKESRMMRKLLYRDIMEMSHFCWRQAGTRHNRRAFQPMSFSQLPCGTLREWVNQGEDKLLEMAFAANATINALKQAKMMEEMKQKQLLEAQAQAQAQAQMEAQQQQQTMPKKVRFAETATNQPN